MPSYAQSKVELPTVKHVKGPRASIVALVPSDTIGKFLKQLDQYSAEQGFRLSSRATRPDQLHFIVNLERVDAQIIALNSFDSVDPAEFTVSVYDSDSGPKLERPEVAAILAQLQSTLCAIRGVTCSTKNQ